MKGLRAILIVVKTGCLRKREIWIGGEVFGSWVGVASDGRIYKNIKTS